MSEMNLFLGIYLFAAVVGTALAIMLLRRSEASDDMDEHYWRDM